MKLISFALCLALSLALLFISVRGGVQVYSSMDAEIIMPSYTLTALTNKIEGSVRFLVVFDKQKVDSISLLSSTLKMGRPPRRPSPPYQEAALVREVQEGFKRTIALWHTNFLNREEHEVEIQLKLDDSLGTSQRRYAVEYKDNLVARVEVIGPGVEWEKAVGSPPPLQ